MLPPGRAAEDCLAHVTALLYPAACRADQLLVSEATVSPAFPCLPLSSTIYSTPSVLPPPPGFSSPPHVLRLMEG